ncbi:MAG: HlyC/CorC family transporter [Acidimicrobiales bacterium]|nr:hemolysin family protein [Acidimicrobiaceae bacterium]MXY01998.1 HlyC/CorC family transporter [Acidimicrobiales bacterium]MDE0134517.1 hemolysin family protein [Acidimicrobiaceae bacterium]MDE0496759.1 hemolysin family protein [Acidimicrobiaceae bacterium]MYG89681.1 HlyC/CorC family transporter [Acidimicrobiales bacterium]
MTTLAIAVGLVLIVFNGAFVAIEFGLIGAKRAVVDGAAATGKRSALAAQRMQSDVLTTLGGAQLGITLCSLAVGRLTEPAIARLIEQAVHGIVEIPDAVLHTIGFGIGLGIVTVLHMVFGEMVPKNLALIGPERTLLVLARPMAAYLYVARPIARALQWVANGMTRMLRVEPTSELADVATPAELTLMARDSLAEGHIAPTDVALLERAMRFEATTLSEVMAPAGEVAAVRLADGIATVEQQFARTGHSRLVVVGSGTDDVRGMLHSNDLAAFAERGAADLAEADRMVAATQRVGRGLVRRMLQFGPDVALDEALRRMQRARIHLAVVADAQGRTLGVVALDDLLRSLIGDPDASVDRTSAAAGGLGSGTLPSD